MAGPPAYVALGDSYAAGLGDGPRTDPCWRAAGGYPVLVARSLGVDLAYQACMGGTISDVLGHQLGPLGPDTRFVSLTIGGNDADFVPVVIEAAKPEWAADLDAVLAVALDKLRTRVPAGLDLLLGTVRDRAPAASLVVTGYPHLFNGTDCALATFFSGSDMERLDAAADELVETIRAAVARSGGEFVDVRSEFVGHAICDDDAWVNGLSAPVEASFHPNPRGHTEYGWLVAQALGAGGLAPPSIGPGEPGEPGVPDVPDVEIVPGPPVPGSAPTFADWPFALHGTEPPA